MPRVMSDQFVLMNDTISVYGSKRALQVGCATQEQIWTNTRITLTNDDVIIFCQKEEGKHNPEGLACPI